MFFLHILKMLLFMFYNDFNILWIYLRLCIIQVSNLTGHNLQLKRDRIRYMSYFEDHFMIVPKNTPLCVRLRF